MLDHAAARRVGLMIGIVVLLAAAVVGGLLFTSTGTSDLDARSTSQDPGEALAQIFDQEVPADEIVGAVGPAAVAALEGIRPVVEVTDASSELLPRYIVAGAEQDDAAAWDVQRQLQRRERVELVIPAGGSVLRIIRTDDEDPVPGPTTDPPTTTGATTPTSAPETTAAPTTAPSTTAPSTTAPSTTTTPATTPPTTAPGDHAPPPSTDPDPSTPPSVEGPGSHVVVPGDNLWSIAKGTLADDLGHPPTDAEVIAYWVDLIEQNRSELPDPGNPDLILPGQVLVLPAT